MRILLGTDLLTLLPLLLQLVGLTCAVLIDPYIRRKHRKIMGVIIALLFSLLMQNYLDHLLQRDGSLPFSRTLVGIYGYSVGPFILILFCCLVGKERPHRFAWVLAGVNAAVHLTAVFSGVCFSITDQNNFHRGPLGYSCHTVCGLLLLYLLFLTVRSFKNVRAREKLIPLFNVLLILGSVVADSVVSYRTLSVSFLTVTAVSSSVFYYIWLHLQFVREHEQALMAEQRIQIMMSQIQPHFLYNTLSTIQALCKTDPDKAFDTTEKFGTYLRQNIDSLRQPNRIPIQKELEHVRIYAEIESIRFPSISVEYDTPDLDFRVPALTVQPLVENAIRHGVRIREKGLVTVRTRKTPDYHEIVVQDNGKGFDLAAAEALDETHIGIRNVRARVEQMCAGSLTVESQLNAGTTVTIRIPLSQTDLPDTLPAV